MREESNKMTPKNFPRPICQIPAFSSKTNKANVVAEVKPDEQYSFTSNPYSPKTNCDQLEAAKDHNLSHGSILLDSREQSTDDHQANDEAELMLPKDSGRERLKRHREEVAAGRVSIPDTWGKEDLLKDWIDYSSFDALLAPNGITSARAALMAERGTSSRRMRIESKCC